MRFVRIIRKKNIKPGLPTAVSHKNQVLQIVAGRRALLNIWVSWLVKIDVDFLK